jgi:hypothetical protein
MPTSDLSKLKYYYQYESDKDVSLYEKLMNTHSIAILASCLEEANVLNEALKLLFNNNGSAFIFQLEIYLEILHDIDMNNNHITIENFFDFIEESEDMSIYKNYKSKTLRTPSKTTLKYKIISGHNNREVTQTHYFVVDKSRVFDNNKIKRLLRSLIPDNEIDRVNYFLSI